MDVMYVTVTCYEISDSDSSRALDEHAKASTNDAAGEMWQANVAYNLSLLWFCSNTHTS